MNGDGKDDNANFANDGPYTSISTGSGFAPPVSDNKILWIHGYTEVEFRIDMHPHFLVDLDSDVKDDIVGFDYTIH